MENKINTLVHDEMRFYAWWTHKLMEVAKDSDDPRLFVETTARLWAASIAGDRRPIPESLDDIATALSGLADSTYAIARELENDHHSPNTVGAALRYVGDKIAETGNAS